MLGLSLGAMPEGKAWGSLWRAGLGRAEFGLRVRIVCRSRRYIAHGDSRARRQALRGSDHKREKKNQDSPHASCLFKYSGQSMTFDHVPGMARTVEKINDITATLLCGKSCAFMLAKNRNCP